MADHGNPGEHRPFEGDGQKLTQDCGHHCGILRAGTHQIEGHCPKPCCHGITPDFKTEINGRIMPGIDMQGVNPRGIH